MIYAINTVIDAIADALLAVAAVALVVSALA